jgi:hypothetical protein
MDLNANLPSSILIAVGISLTRHGGAFRIDIFIGFVSGFLQLNGFEIEVTLILTLLLFRRDGIAMGI